MFRSNERSEDSNIGLSDFFVFFRKKSENIDALMIMHFLSSVEIHLLKMS